MKPVQNAQHAPIQKVFTRANQTLPRFFVVVFFIRGKRIQIALKAGHQQPASKMPIKWRFADGAMMAQHLMLAW